MTHPLVKSRRQHIRLWFEFYKLCLDDPDLQENLKSTHPFYEPWGECRGVRFDDWWKDHGYLFGGTNVEVVNRVRNQPNLIHLSIPLNLAVSKTLPEIKALIQAEQVARLDELGMDPKNEKSLASGFGTYELTKGELRGKTLNEALLVYTMWRECDKPAINSAFCQFVVDSLKSRPRSKWVPHILQKPAATDRKGAPRFADDQLRQIRRYIKRAENVCTAVSKGKFPGRSTLK